MKLKLRFLSLALAVLVLCAAFSACANPAEPRESNSFSVLGKSWDEINFSSAVTTEDELFLPSRIPKNVPLFGKYFFRFGVSKSFPPTKEDAERWVEAVFLLSEQNSCAETELSNHLCESEGEMQYIIPFDVFKEFFLLYFPTAGDPDELIKSSRLYDIESNCIIRFQDRVGPYTFAAVGGAFIASVEKEAPNRLIITGCAVVPDSLPEDGNLITLPYILEHCDYYIGTLTAELQNGYWQYVAFESENVKNT